jgi:hypothetical protein
MDLIIIFRHERNISMDVSSTKRLHLCYDNISTKLDFIDCAIFHKRRRDFLNTIFGFEASDQTS